MQTVALGETDVWGLMRIVLLLLVQCLSRSIHISKFVCVGASEAT